LCFDATRRNLRRRAECAAWKSSSASASSNGSTLSTPRICVFGAGSIGCYVGGRLAAAGAELTLIGRERLGRELARHGLHLTDFRGTDVRVGPDGLRFATDAAAASDAALVLVTVKSADTALAAQSLAPVLGRDAIVVSFQNGLGNADLLKEHLRQQVVLAGMVPFNVVNRGQGAFHQGSEGSLDVEGHPAMAGFTRLFDAAGLPLTQHPDMRPVQWAKLLLNLNNPVNALSNLPLKQELSQRAYRRCVALAQREALALLGAAGIRPARLTPVPPRWIPALLSLPDGLFTRVADTMLAIDPLARSSMWEDLEAGRRTEVDWLNGEIVRLARSQGREAPVNERLLGLIRAAEGGGPRNWSGRALLVELNRAAGQGRETVNAR
jgi:2-dehydropantoate 2-reductase